MVAGLNSYIKRGDDVVVISGKDKGKRGKVARVFPKTDRVIVEGVNMVKRHMRPTRMGDEAGIVNKEAPLHVSNIMIADPKTGEPTRVGFRMDGDKKVRFAKKSGEAIDS